MALVCDLEATPYKYLVSIKIKATPATIRTHKPEYEIRTGAGAFVASLRLPSWAVRRGMMHRRAGLMHAKVWPRTDLQLNKAIQCAKENRPRPLSGYLVGIPVLIHDQLWRNSRPGRVEAVMDRGSSLRT